jgi:hypothetical protein
MRRSIDARYAVNNLALRDISDLLVRGVLRKSDAGGRSTNYELSDFAK